MSSLGSNDDCYFYFYSSCTKGDECPFRHCQSALGTETVCSMWREGRCFRSNCKFRHMESRINRASIPCYWENQPGGCRKPHCVFFHQKARSITQDSLEKKRLILPVYAINQTSTPVSKSSDTNDEIKSALNNTSLSDSISKEMEHINHNPEPQAVKPFVVSFDEGEESDTESVSSTPVKSSHEGRSIQFNSAKVNLSSQFKDNNEKDFGIKTLEQIRMEKIHKESEHFYKSDDTTVNGIANKSVEIGRNSSLLSDAIFCYSAYDAPSLDSSHLELSADRMQYNQQDSYPPNSDFISIPHDTPMDESLSSTINGSTLHAAEQEKDLRGRLLKRRAAPLPEKDLIVKKVITLKKSKHEIDDPLNFKIKTLDEIRKEKESKLVSGAQDGGAAVSNSLVVSTLTTEEISVVDTNIAQQSIGRPKIKRHSRKLYSVCNTAINGSNGSLKNESWPKVVVNEVQSSSEKENKNKVPTDERSIYPSKRKRNAIERSIAKRSNKLQMMTDSVVNVSRDANNSPGIINECLEESDGDDKHDEKETESPVRCRTLPTPPLTPSPPPQPTTSGNLSEGNGIKDNCNSEDHQSQCQVNEVSSLKDTPFSVTSTTFPEEKETQQRTCTRSLSSDDIDHLLLNDTDVNLDGDDAAEGGAEDILLEIEQLLDS